jgi:hypothetical protein
MEISQIILTSLETSSLLTSIVEFYIFSTCIIHSLNFITGVNKVRLIKLEYTTKKEIIKIHSCTYVEKSSNDDELDRLAKMLTNTRGNLSADFGGLVWFKVDQHCNIPGIFVQKFCIHLH